MNRVLLISSPMGLIDGFNYANKTIAYRFSGLVELKKNTISLRLDIYSSFDVGDSKCLFVTP